MFSKIPTKDDAFKQEGVERGMLRAAIMAELDAISLYEQMAETTQNRNLRKIFLDVAKEEKTHVGEFQALLLRIDPEQAEELGAGDREVREKTGLGLATAA